MQKISSFLLLIFFAFAITSKAQPSEVVANYIFNYKQLAIDEMKRTGVPAAITLAQGIHESGAGKSALASKSNNHFGIKCKTGWAGEKVYHDDDARGECFRKYAAVTESYVDHSDFLRNGQRYSFLFQLDPEDYIGWANGLKKAGYATNPKYPQILIKLIEDYGLQHYTMIGVGKIPDAFNPDDPSVQTQNNDNGEKKVVVDEKSKEPAVTHLPEPVKTIQYPTGVFSINDTRVVYITKGTSFFSVAAEHRIDLAKLFDFNDMKPSEVAAEDLLIYLQRKRKTGKDDFYTVLPGETLHDIAQKQAIRLESLVELNALKSGEIPVAGTVLTLKKKSDGIIKKIFSK